MSMKIKVSYEYPEELQYIKDRLKGMIQKQSKPSKSGRYTRVYLTVEKPDKA